MKQRAATLGIFVVLAVGLAACESSKSENPLSPTVAGPIAGVDITAPKLLLPAAGQRVPVAEQPVTLTLENASTSGQRPLKYTFEIAVDAGFTNKVFSREAVDPGTTGRTSVTLSEALASGRTYYWRAMALDGANSGPYASAANFDVYTPVVIQAPTLVSPVDGVKVTTTKPTFKANNAARTGPVGAVTYNFQVSETQAFSAVVLNAAVPEQASQTAYTATQDLTAGKTYYWRVRASDPTTTGAWSVTQWFVGPDQVVTPTPTPDPVPGGSSGDQLSVGTAVIVKGPSAFASWSATSTVTSVTTSGGNLCIYHSMLGKWPSTAFFGDPSTQVEGNQWVFAYISGRWYGGSADWYRPGQACKGVTADGMKDAFYNASEEPLHSWTPRPGEQVGFGSSTPARAWPDMKTLDQRTNIVIVSWRD
jgi:hypothetical protein